MLRAEAAEQTFHSPQVAIWRKLRRITAKFLWGRQTPKAVWMKSKVVGSGCGGVALSPSLTLSSRCQGICSILCAVRVREEEECSSSAGRLWDERNNYSGAAITQHSLPGKALLFSFLPQQAPLGIESKYVCSCSPLVLPEAAGNFWNLC